MLSSVDNRNLDMDQGVLSSFSRLLSQLELGIYSLQEILIGVCVLHLGAMPGLDVYCNLRSPNDPYSISLSSLFISSLLGFARY